MLFYVSLTLLFTTLCVDAMPAKRQALAQVITKCTVPKTAALTFDDGPYTYTTEVANMLTAAGAKGTFFFNGNNYECIYAAENVARVKNAYEKGHQIASHTWKHNDLATLSADQVNSEMGLLEEALERILGVKTTFTRPPFGSYNTVVQQVAAARNQTIVIWDFDSGDSSGKTAAESEAAYTALAAANPPTILTLNHETMEGTVKQVLPAAIAALKAKGYSLVTVAECLGVAPYSSVGTPQAGPFTCAS